LITAAQFLRWVFWFDPHADPHGETSGWKQRKQEGQRALNSEQKVLKTSGNCSFYSFSTFRNQQVAGSSPATSSRNQRKSRDFRRFSLKFSKSQGETMTFAEKLTRADAAGRLGVSRQIGQDL